MSAEIVYIGMAKMAEDGTLVLDLRAEGPNAVVGHGRVTYAPGDAHYQEVLDHLGGMAPGDEKPVPPWPEPDERKAE